jgi:hypothetical protein
MPPQRVLNVAPSPDRHQDYPVAQAREQGLLDGTPVPAEVDLRRPWWTIGDQEETGSCVGWALADSVMRRQLVEAGRLAPDEPLSPRFVWMAAKEMRAKLGAVTGDPSWRPGTSLERAYTSLKAGLEVARRFGVALEAEVPWRGGLYQGDVDTFFAGAARRRLRSYWSLDEPDVGGTVDNWREWLNERGPILVKIAVDAQLEAGSRDVLEAFDPGSVRDRHAAALVGYGPGHFLLRSSWGTDWADEGYVRLADGYAADAIEESYGVIT